MKDLLTHKNKVSPNISKLILLIVDLIRGENTTYSFNRSDLTDKTIYVFMKSNQNNSLLQFSMISQDIPQAIPDYSVIARICTLGLIFFIVVIVTLTVIEAIEECFRKEKVLRQDQDKFLNRLGGIDFDEDRKRLLLLARKTKDKFGTTCFKHRHLFKN